MPEFNPNEFPARCGEVLTWNQLACEYGPLTALADDRRIGGGHADRAALWDDRAPAAPVAGSWELRLTAELDDGGGQVSVVVCEGIEQRGAGLAPPDVLGAADVGGPSRVAVGLRLPW
ncbi:hypothetical protein ACFQ0T_09070 [Kitasatospora gansuensis]